MIVDLVSFRVKQDRQQEFERHNEDWVRLMRRSRGFVTQRLMRRIDRPGEYVASVRWVNRDFRDRFHGADDAERRMLRQKAADLLEGPPDSVLLESC
jgi:heme-degrading monooxygenase HmoA